ncbi:MAG: YwiC-like family protein [Candidatus Koribacter versatilis]|uniref:YwiC-like family protein n=1 Tax=Candidatus Korobacter versatilis TaxID=658062 RepID=A0A932A788_9BACT|nr:YwiC-like family protein [Candidatus Koribacter versatilis]
MSSQALVEQELSIERVRAAVLWPREHGAWGLLSAPLLLGTIVARRAAGSDWMSWSAFVVAAVALFLLRTPLEARIGHGVVRVANERERRATDARVAWFGTVALVATGLVLSLLPIVPVLLAGIVAAAAYGASWSTGISKRSAQLLAALAMAAGAPLACIALAGTGIRRTTLLCALAGAAFITADQVSFVHLKVATLQNGTRVARWRTGWLFLLFQSFTVVALALAVQRGLLTPVALLGFAPMLVRGFWHFLRNGNRVSFRRLGFTELAYTAIAVGGLGMGIAV